MCVLEIPFGKLILVGIICIPNIKTNENDQKHALVGHLRVIQGCSKYPTHLLMSLEWSHVEICLKIG